MVSLHLTGCLHTLRAKGSGWSKPLATIVAFKLNALTNWALYTCGTAKVVSSYSFPSHCIEDVARDGPCAHGIGKINCFKFNVALLFASRNIFWSQRGTRLYLYVLFLKREKDEQTQHGRGPVELDG